MRQDKNKKEKIMKSKSIGILESKDFSGVIIAVNTIKVVELPDYPEGSNGEMMRGIVVCDGPDGDYIEKTSSRRNNYLATTDDAIDECRKIWDNDRRYNFIVTRNS